MPGLRQILDHGLVVFLFLHQFQRTEYRAALGQNVHAAVGIILDLRVIAAVQPTVATPFSLTRMIPNSRFLRRQWPIIIL